jgi:hypothetical protein
MLKLSSHCTRFKCNYRSCSTGRSSENIYVAAVEELRKKERQDETQFTTKIDAFVSFTPLRMQMYFFAGFFFDSQPVCDQTQGSSAVFPFHYRELHYLACPLSLVTWEVMGAKNNKVGKKNKKGKSRGKICRHTLVLIALTTMRKGRL